MNGNFSDQKLGFTGTPFVHLIDGKIYDQINPDIMLFSKDKI